eukprot:862963-Rhodomonas_salina.1
MLRTRLAVPKEAATDPPFVLARPLPYLELKGYSKPFARERVEYTANSGLNEVRDKLRQHLVELANAADPLPLWTPPRKRGDKDLTPYVWSSTFATPPT